MKKIKYILALFIVSTAFGQKQTNNVDFSNMLQGLLTHSVPEVLPSEIQNMDQVVFLDAREKTEFATSHIKNALWVGYDNFKKKNVEEVPKDKQIVVYCTVGYRSEKIAEKLNKMGYTNVSNLYGGIFEWYHNDRKVFNENAETKKIHTYDKEWSQWLQKGEKVY